MITGVLAVARSQPLLHQSLEGCGTPLTDCYSSLPSLPKPFLSPTLSVLCAVLLQPAFSSGDRKNSLWLSHAYCPPNIHHPELDTDLTSCT